MVDALTWVLPLAYRLAKKPKSYYKKQTGRHSSTMEPYFDQIDFTMCTSSTTCLQTFW